MQPDAINGAVEKPNSSAPNNAPITTSRPVLSPPSTWTDIRDLSLFFIKVWCVSAKPSSQTLGAPMRLADLGLLETDLERAAQIATEKPYWNPRDITKDAILRILKQAWAGEPPELT